MFAKWGVTSRLLVRASIPIVKLYWKIYLLKVCCSSFLDKSAGDYSIVGVLLMSSEMSGLQTAVQSSWNH